jgi:hypothetical protein
MCRNGQYTERGIKAWHGYAGQRYRTHPEYAKRLDPALDRVAAETHRPLPARRVIAIRDTQRAV